VDPICPLLSLGGDARVVSATPDAAHRCLAGATPAPIERDYQARFCLTSQHEMCERYVAHLAEVGTVGAAWRQASPDTSYESTRLVVEAAPRSVIRRSPRRIGRAALVVIDSVIRLLPGAIDEASTAEESFTHGLLEYPQYTRPPSFDGAEVPPILVSGDHGAVRRWRIKESLRRTLERRPDLLVDRPASPEERRLLDELAHEEDGSAGRD
jgi:hypothetical protein